MKNTFTAYDFAAIDINGEMQKLSQYNGKILLIVNTASSGQGKKMLKKLEHLYQQYINMPFVILAFPCRQFMNQEHKSNEKIRTKYIQKLQLNYAVYQRVKVNGKNAHPLFKWLKKQKSGPLGARIEWNFTKFLINHEGKVVKRFSSNTPWSKIAKSVDKYVMECRKLVQLPDTPSSFEEPIRTIPRDITSPFPVPVEPAADKIASPPRVSSPRVIIEVDDF